MPTAAKRADLQVERVAASAFTIPTEEPESDGTLDWDSTTIVVVEVETGGMRGLGYSYTDASAREIVERLLAACIRGRDAMDIPAAHSAMRRAVRNIGLAGVAAAAISAVDVALWDLKARLLDLSLGALLGREKESVQIYGSGGFTSYSGERLTQQLTRWVENGIDAVKMKVGREPDADLARVAAARKAIGPDVDLFVDANGAYSRKEALAFANAFVEYGVSWFEEPVPAGDIEGLRLLRDCAPGGMDVAAGEYGFDAGGFRRLLEAGAVDVLQPDATRCQGLSGFLQAATLAAGFGIDVSAHTAPALHVHAGCAAENIRHIEWFHDHVRIEELLFDGAPHPEAGRVRPDRDRPGLGLELKRPDATTYEV